MICHEQRSISFSALCSKSGLPSQRLAILKCNLIMLMCILMRFLSVSNCVPSTKWALSDDYEPPRGRRILILLPCSKTKPYSSSVFHRRIEEFLIGFDRSIHYCTISERLGVVPKELEGSTPYYDTYPDEFTSKFAIDSLVWYVTRYTGFYDSMIAYATSKIFRYIINESNKKLKKGIQLIPEEGSFLPKSAFFEYMKKRYMLMDAIVCSSIIQ